MGFLSFIPVRIWAGAGLFVVLALGAWKLHHDGYRTGYKAGSAEVQARWDKDVAAREKAWRGVIARQVKATQEIERDLSKQIEDARRSERGLASRLFQRERELAAAKLASAAAPAVPADGTCGDNRDPEAARLALEQGLQDHLDACAVVTVKYGQLQKYITDVVQRGVIVRD